MAIKIIQFLRVIPIFQKNLKIPVLGILVNSMNIKMYVYMLGFCEIEMAT